MAVFRRAQQRNREDSNTPALSREEVSSVWERFCIEAFKLALARTNTIDPVRFHLATEEEREAIRVAAVKETVNMATSWADKMTVAWAKSHGVEVSA